MSADSDIIEAGLYDISLNEAAEIIFADLEDKEQATLEEIKNGLIESINKGALVLSRGSLEIIGKYTLNTPYVKLSDAEKWAHDSGLGLIKYGEFSDRYFIENCVLDDLKNRIGYLRDYYRKTNVIPQTHFAYDPDSAKKEIYILMNEKRDLEEKIKIQQEELNYTIDKRSKSSLLEMIIGLTIYCYGYNPKRPRSDVYREISEDLSRIKISLHTDTARKWIRDAIETVLPYNWDEGIEISETGHIKAKKKKN
jgi:hypothetical protein